MERSSSTDRRRALLYPDFKELYIRLKRKRIHPHHQYKRDFDRWRNSTSVSTFETPGGECLVIWCDQRNLSQYHATNGFDRCLEGLEKRLKEYGIDTKLKPHLDTTKYKRTPANAGTSWTNGTYLLTNSYISVYSRPGCATTLPADTCRPVPDEVAHAEVEVILEHKHGKEYTSPPLMSSSTGTWRISRPAEGIGLACWRVKFAWINCGRLRLHCVDMENTSRSLLLHNRKRCLEQILTKCEQLRFHKECAGCTHALSVMSAMPMPAFERAMRRHRLPCCIAKVKETKWKIVKTFLTIHIYIPLDHLHGMPTFWNGHWWTKLIRAVSFRSLPTSRLTPTCTLNWRHAYTHRTQRGGTARRFSPTKQWLDWAEQLQDMGRLFILHRRWNRCSIHASKELYAAARNGIHPDSQYERAPHRQRNGTHLADPQAAADKRHPVWRQQRNLRTLFCATIRKDTPWCMEALNGWKGRHWCETERGIVWKNEKITTRSSVWPSIWTFRQK